MHFTPRVPPLPLLLCPSVCPSPPPLLLCPAAFAPRPAHARCRAAAAATLKELEEAQRQVDECRFDMERASNITDQSAARVKYQQAKRALEKLEQQQQQQQQQDAPLEVVAGRRAAAVRAQKRIAAMPEEDAKVGGLVRKWNAEWQRGGKRSRRRRVEKPRAEEQEEPEEEEEKQEEEEEEQQEEEEEQQEEEEEEAAQSVGNKRKYGGGGGGGGGGEISKYRLAYGNGPRAVTQEDVDKSIEKAVTELKRTFQEMLSRALPRAVSSGPASNNAAVRVEQSAER